MVYLLIHQSLDIVDRTVVIALEKKPRTEIHDLLIFPMTQNKSKEQRHPSQVQVLNFEFSLQNFVLNVFNYSDNTK